MKKVYLSKGYKLYKDNKLFFVVPQSGTYYYDKTSVVLERSGYPEGVVDTREFTKQDWYVFLSEMEEIQEFKEGLQMINNPLRKLL